MNLRLSPSAIAAWRECPAKYWRQYLAEERWPDNPVYFAQGRVTHKMVEIAINGQTRARNAGNTLKDPTLWIDAGFEREWNREAKKVTDWKGLKPEKAQAQALGASHAVVAVCGNWEVEATEEKFVVPIAEGVVMPGVIDIRQKVRIVDVKTYSTDESPYDNAQTVSEQFQMRAYGLGTWHATGILPSEGQYLSVSMNPPHEVTLSPVVPITYHHAIAAAAQIRIAARAIRNGQFGKRWKEGCKSCPFKNYHANGCPGDTAA